MKITAALPWFNEKIDDLDRCVRGLVNVADKLVALDGSYVRYPGAKAKSPIGQVDAIQRAADAIGIECEIVQPDTIWAGQVEKRSHLVKLASVGSDWICTLDADQIITANRKDVRTILEVTDADVFEVIYYTPNDKTRPKIERSVGLWHEEQAGSRVWIPHIYRVYPEMRVERFHWWYSAVKNGERVWLWSRGDGEYPMIQHHPFPIPYEVEHRTLFRSKEQILNSRAFCNDREMVVRLTGQEDHQPGLLPPVFDYETMPW